MRTILIVGVVVLLGCSTQENRMSNQPPFLGGISSVRPRDTINIATIYGKTEQEVDQLCREKIRGRGVYISEPTIALQASLSQEALPYPRQRYEGCAFVPKDSQIANKQPFCDIVLPVGTKPGDELYEHEIKHCMGFDHPF